MVEEGPALGVVSGEKDVEGEEVQPAARSAQERNVWKHHEWVPSDRPTLTLEGS